MKCISEEENSEKKSSLPGEDSPSAKCTYQKPLDIFFFYVIAWKAHQKEKKKPWESNELSLSAINTLMQMCLSY